MKKTLTRPCAASQHSYTVNFRNILRQCALFLLLAGGCTTPPSPSAPLGTWAPEGLYHFRCDIINQDNLVRVVHEDTRLVVELLGEYKGSFKMVPLADQRVNIEKSRLDYPGLKRTFSGEGTVQRPGQLSGTAIMWLKGTGPISRNHREGPWSLRPATPREQERFRMEQKRLEERRQRAQEALREKEN